MSDKEIHVLAVCYSLLLERHCNLVSDIATPAAAVCNRDSCMHDLQWECHGVHRQNIATMLLHL